MHPNRAVAGSAMIANAPGSVSDIVTENYRALAFSIWSIGPMNGPVTGPLIGGFAAEYLGWRWTNWLVMILSGAGWIFCSSMQETYAPVILQRKAAKMRKETGDDRWWCRYDQRSSRKLQCVLQHNPTLIVKQYLKCSRSTFRDRLFCRSQSQFCGFGMLILLYVIPVPILSKRKLSYRRLQNSEKDVV